MQEMLLKRWAWDMLNRMVDHLHALPETSEGIARCLWEGGCPTCDASRIIYRRIRELELELGRKGKDA